eukprot:PITA_30204
MKILSYNCRGFASNPKKLALKRLLTSSALDIIFLQETLYQAEPLTKLFNSWFPSWHFQAIDATGRSGGLAIGINNSHLLESEILSADNILLGGDLNFSLGFCESWGHHAQIDPLSDTLTSLLEDHNWIDIPSARLQYTWTNNRNGEQSLARRLDRFLVKEPLYNVLARSRQWVGSGGISDHRPIFFEAENTSQKIKSPFKFNASWLQDPSYIRLVQNFWNTNPIRDNEDISAGFVRKLSELKRITKIWAHQKRIQDNQTLQDAEKTIADFEAQSSGIFPTPEKKEEYTTLITRRSQILKEREESWRLRSRAIWLLEGDANTKFYHKFANGRKAINTIWELMDENGHPITSQRNLANFATGHFRGIYKARADVNILEIMRIIELFPSFVNQEDSEELMKEVTMAELEATLKWFKRDKSPGPDGWTIEFYISFFDTLGNDLLQIVEDSRRRGRISSAIKSTFIALIPKSNASTTFDDFRPISLCNCLYKIIAKTIANRLKPILSQHISSEQFAFLHHRQIHEAVASAHELLHTLHIKKQKGMILKVDLSKAFDRSNWLYLRSLLTHLGFSYPYIKWTMSCITDVNYSVLLNGEATNFFTAERGLRQGCPLSPLLFLLIMEGLSRLLASARDRQQIMERGLRQGCPLSPLLFLLIMEGLSRLLASARDRQQIMGIKIAEDFFLTHLLFVDDVLIFLNGSIGDSTALQHAMHLFQMATGMKINVQKSTITTVGCTTHESAFALQRFPFNSLTLAEGIKYLGFRLKPIGYKIADWLWLITKVERRLQIWYHRYLSRARRLILIKAVIEATPVYWMALTWIPKGILHRLQHICSRFLWAGQKPGRLFAWVRWDTIAKPKSWGGWGIKKLDLFSKALAAKLGWKLLTLESLWTKVAYAKYINPLNILDWICTQPNTLNISSIWKAVVNTIPLLRDGLTWRIREGNSVRIGKDPWVGCGNAHRLPIELIEHLKVRGITHIAHIGDPECSTFLYQAWLNVHHLAIPAQWHNAWNEYTAALSQAHIRLTEGPDEIIWALAKNGTYSPKMGYLTLIEPTRPPIIHPTWRALWKLKSAPRTRLLFWNILFDKIPTGTNLMKRSFHGPYRCHLCLNEEESTAHLFLHCNISKQFWNLLTGHIPQLQNWKGNSILEAWESWLQHHTGKSRNIPLLACWAIWIARNKAIFDHHAPHWPTILLNTIDDYNIIPDEDTSAPTRISKPLYIDKTKPWAFFDGSAQETGCGGGAILHVSDTHCFKLQINLVRGTNNYAELCTAKHIIHYAIQKHCRHLQLFGDSKIVCSWLNNTSQCHTFTLSHILDDARRLITSFDSFSCTHIYKEQNTSAYHLSKEAALRQGDQWLILEELDGQFYQHYHRPFDDLMDAGH